MKKTAIFISLLAIGAFVANAQDDTRTPSSTETQKETSTPSTTTSPSRDAMNPGSVSTTEGTAAKGTKLEISALPKAISDNISSQHKGWTTQEVYKIDHQGATAYKVLVKKDDQQMKLVYDANGNLLKSEPKSGSGKGTSSTDKKSGTESTAPATETR